MSLYFSLHYKISLQLWLNKHLHDTQIKFYSYENIKFQLKYVGKNGLTHLLIYGI